MPSASAKKRKEKGRNAERNRARKGVGAETKDVKREESLEAQRLADIEANKTSAEVAKEMAELAIKENALKGATDIELLRASEAKLAAEARNCTGVLTSEEKNTSIHIHGMSIIYHGQILIEETELKLDAHHRYGIIGPNGCGKSTLMAAIGNRELPIPSNFDIFYLDHEMAPSDKTPLESVMDVGEQRLKLEKEADILQETDPESEYLLELYERLDDLDVDKAEATASRILRGLGFTKEMQHKKMSDFSGGWRMRVSLARALFVKPYVLLLDEPTNHLDLEACVWLEEELKNFNHILMIVSHSQDFMNGVCSDIIHILDKKMEYYSGNYDQFVKTKNELEVQQMKRYNWEQEQIAHMKEYIARFGHGSAKLARQAQSKEKTLKKMIEGGLTEKVKTQSTISMNFKDVDVLPPPVIQVQNVSFKYHDNAPWIYQNLEFGLDMDTRLALVGPNGAGKSTLLKMLLGQLDCTGGMIRRHSHVKMGHYHQHSSESLDMDLTPLEFMNKMFPDTLKEVDTVRKIVGRYGISGKQQTMPIRQLSEGQKCRVAFAWIAWQSPHMLMLDEPTNHLDIESIDALADAIKKFNGGLVLVSHDFRLISQVAKDIWICEKQTVTPWTKGILAYKDILKRNVLGEDGKKKDMAAASADHYHKTESTVPIVQKKAAPVKQMKISLGNAGGKRDGSGSPASAKKGGKFVPPGKRGAAEAPKGKAGGDSKEDWW